MKLHNICRSCNRADCQILSENLCAKMKVAILRARDAFEIKKQRRTSVALGFRLLERARENRSQEL